MLNPEKADIAKRSIENGAIKFFREIFAVVSKTEMSKQLGINYSRFLQLVDNPKKLRYSETYAMARLLDVPAHKISELVHNQLDAPKDIKKPRL